VLKGANARYSIPEIGALRAVRCLWIDPVERPHPLREIPLLCLDHQIAQKFKHKVSIEGIPSDARRGQTDS
jgi:hypothetical protein